MKFVTTAVILMLVQAIGASDPGGGILLPRMLHPAYQDLVPRPAEMYGFWLWTGPDSIREQVERACANASSLHLMVRVEEAEDSPRGVRVAPRQVDDAGLDALAGAGVGLGEHNNPFFVRYPQWFWKLRQEARMKDANGKTILAGANQVPAMLDPLLTRLAREQMANMVRLLGDEHWVRYWVIGGEQSWPDYFGLPEGDHSPAVRRHFAAWRTRTGRTDWQEFRDSVVVDRYAGYTAHLHSLDPTRPAMVPTHGNPFAFDFRARLGYPLGDLAGVSDGFEAGPISIDDDAERIIRMTLDQQTSFGLPAVAPRLANKQLDPMAKGGGRGFSPSSLRRAVYEALGLGAWHVGLVHWTGDLPDGEWGIAGTPAESEAKRVFEELRRAAPYLDGCSRLQPRVGIFISDAAWRSRWQDRWTLLYDEAVKRGWSVVLLIDAQVDAQLVEVTPWLISADNSVLSEDAIRRLDEYTRAGGKIIVPEDADGPPVHLIHQTQTTSGANTWPAEVKPLDLDAVEAAVGEDLRPVTVIEGGTHAEGIEPLLLTDGTNVQVVLINRTNKRRSIRLSSDNVGQVRDLLTGELLLGDIFIQPHGTALLSIEPAVAAVDAMSEVERAAAAVCRWQRLDAETAQFESALDRARDHLDAARPAKAYALARTITQGLAFRATADERDGFKCEIRVWDSDGRVIRDAAVRARLVPGRFEWSTMRETSPGAYRLDLPKARLPLFYNPAAEQYELAAAATQVIVEVSSKGRLGGIRIVTGRTDAAPTIQWSRESWPGWGFKAPLELRNGDILAARTEGVPSGGVSIFAYRSTDGGKSWSRFGEIIHSDEPHIDIGDGHLTQMRNGDVLHSYRRNLTRGTKPEDRTYRLEVAVSRDNGATWQPHSEVARASGEFRGLWSTFLLEKNDGTLQCYYDDEDTPSRNGFLRHQWLTMKSWDSKSLEWINPVTVSRAHNPEHLSRDGMCSLVELSENKLFCAFETVQTYSPHRGMLMYVTSDDGGKTWSWQKQERGLLYQPPNPDFNALASWMIKLSTGELMCVFTTDEDREKPGVAATAVMDQSLKYIISRDGGKTWSKAAIVDPDHPIYFPGICELKHGKQEGKVLVQYNGRGGHRLKYGYLAVGKPQK